MEYTSKLVKQKVNQQILQMRDEALSRGIPVTDGETLNYLMLMLTALKPKKILEIGTAEGLSGSAMLLQVEGSRLTTVEINESEYNIAKANFAKLNLTDRVTQLLGDAGDVINMLDGEFDFIFLDGPKAQYINYLFDLKRLLKVGGVLFADDVLLYGYISGETPVPNYRRGFVDKIKQFVEAVSDDKQLITSVLNVGEGVAVSVKVK